jgi:predicted transcriptional regulator
MAERGPRDLFGIGSLEAEIMTVVWDIDRSVKVREVYERMRLAHPGEERAYTTVMTVMNNLVKKKLLRVSKKERTYAYWPTLGRKDLVLSLLAKVRPMAGESWKSILKEAS